MHRMHRMKLLVVLLGIAMASVAGCKSRHESQPSPTSAPRDDADFAQTRDRVVQQMQDRLSALDVKLTNLKRDVQARSAQLTSEGKAALADAVAKLEDQRAAAQRALEQTRTGTAERWDQLRARADEVLKKIDDAYEAAAKKLRE